MGRRDFDVIVDATGYGAALARRLPSSCGIDFSDRRDDRILAEVRTYKIDRAAAAAQAKAGDFVPEVLHHTIGRYGSFSTLSFTISLDFEMAWLLAGILDANMPPTPAEALDDLAQRFPFLKEETSRGASPIRIRRAGLRLVTDGFAVVGEAAGMVIPLQASGVTSSLLAGDSLGRHLGDILQNGGRATTETLWPWAAAYQRGRGAVLASYDANRRLLRTLDPHSEVEPLFRSGLSQPEDMYRAFGAQPLRVSAQTLPARSVPGGKSPTRYCPRGRYQTISTLSPLRANS